MRILGTLKGAALGAVLALLLGAGLYLSPWRQDLFRAASADFALARATVERQQEDMAALEARIAAGDASDSLKNHLAAARSEYHAGREKLETLWQSGERATPDGFFAWLGALGTYAIPLSLLLIATGGLAGSVTGGSDSGRGGAANSGGSAARRVPRPSGGEDDLQGLEAAPRARRTVTTRFPKLSPKQSALLQAIRKAGRVAAEAEREDAEDPGPSAPSRTGSGTREREASLNAEPNAEQNPEGIAEGSAVRSATPPPPPEEKPASAATPVSPEAPRSEPPRVESPWASAERPFASAGNSEGDPETEFLEMPEVWKPTAESPAPPLVMEDEPGDWDSAGSSASPAAEEDPPWGKMPETTEFEQLERQQDEMLKLARKGLTPAEISLRLRISQEQVALFLRSRRERGA